MSGIVFFSVMPAVSFKDCFIESLARCQQRDEFLGEFYNRLLASDPEIKQRFRFTNFDRQQVMLHESLRTCAKAVAGEPEGLSKLTELAVTHDQYHRDIRPEWYETWLRVIIETASEFDPEWSPDVEESWRTTLGYVTKRMASRYSG